MSELTLISSSDLPLRAIIESALSSELRLLEVALHQTQHRLQGFEERFQLSTTEFVTRYAENEIDETLETIEWLGEQRMAEHIQEKIDALNEIRFAN